VAIADAAQEAEAMLEAAFVQIVEEQAADSTGFAAVLDIEVLVAPALEAGVVVGAERIARRFRHAMPMHAVLLVAVVRREVEAAAEPPDGLGVRALGD